MEIKYWIDVIISILTGLTICIPLVIQLNKTIKSAVEEKNWNKIVATTLDFIAEAERKFTEGEAKKAWVLAEVRKAAECVAFNYDLEAERKVADMIDAICATANVVNTAIKSKEKQS